MIKAARIAISLVAITGVGATFAACGGVPGNAVATVDGEAIDKTEFSHWLNIAAKASGQPNAAVPDPESDYAKCVAAKRKTTPAPAKGQPKVTDTQLKTQCKQEYDQLRNQVLQLLISFKGGRLAVTPIEMDAATARRLREILPGANYEAGRSQLSLRVPDDPSQHFSAVINAADILLSVQAAA